MKLPIKIYDDPILRKRGQTVEKITDEIRELVANMIETMDAHKGIGLAAQQVGVPLRIFVRRDWNETDDGHFEMTEAEVYINPKLSEPSKEHAFDNEGCLSFPKLYIDVARPVKITVEALDINGVPFKKEFEGYKARNIMHENDHINGVLFIDRLDPKERKRLDPVLRDFMKKWNAR